MLYNWGGRIISVQYPSDFHVNRNLKVFGGNFAGLWSWKVFPACVGLTS